MLTRDINDLISWHASGGLNPIHPQLDLIKVSAIKQLTHQASQHQENVYEIL